MVLTLDTNAIAALSLAQKRAILESLYLVIAVDREVEDAERKRLEDEVSRIEWGIEAPAIRALWVATRDRVIATKEREQWLAWVDAIAQQIPAALQVPVLATMGRLALVRDVNQRERGLLNMFALAFGITQDVADQLKASLAPAVS